MQKYRNPVSRALASNYWKRRVLAPEICDSPHISDALQIIRSRWPQTSQAQDDSEAPIFIMAATWGSGSTLLQRLVVSGGDTLIWGEPFDHAVPVHRLAQILVPITDRWPKDQFFTYPERSEDLSSTWIANLTPNIESLRQAHRQFFIRWLRDSAVSHDCKNWGLKEVRLTIDHARYLKWLFPQAKFLFIVRDVIDSYRSCKDVRWLSVWPDHRVNRVTAFAHHWVHVAAGFKRGVDEVGGLMLRYEDLAKNQVDMESLSRYLEFDLIKPDAIGHRIGSRSESSKSVTQLDRYLLDSISISLRNELGYA